MIANPHSADIVQMQIINWVQVPLDHCLSIQKPIQSCWMSNNTFHVSIDMLKDKVGQMIRIPNTAFHYVYLLAIFARNLCPKLLEKLRLVYPSFPRDSSPRRCDSFGQRIAISPDKMHLTPEH